MPMTLDQLEAEARRLPAHERARLIERLAATLDEDEADLASVERAWIEEADRRYRRYLAGETEAVPAADALARVRARLGRL